MSGLMSKEKKRKDFYTYYKKSINKILFRWIDLRKIMVLKRILKKEQEQHRKLVYTKHVSKQLSILEIGAGTGTIMSLFSQDHAIYAIDRNEKLLAISKRKGLIPIEATMDTFLPFKKETFDIVVSIDAIEHFSYRHHSIEEIARVLKKDGLCIHFTPPYDSISWVLAEKIHNLFLHTQSDHVSPFTKESMAYLLQKHFYDIKIKYLNMGMTMCCIARKE